MAFVGTGTFVDSSRSATVDMNAAPAVCGTVSTGNSDAGIQVGAFGGGYGFNGQIAEVAAFSRVISSTERRSVQEYLGRKWAVTITPQAPVSPSGTPGNTTATVSWTAPAWNGGASVSSYTVTPSGAGSCTWSSGTTASCTGLTHNVSYTFAVSAANSAGVGPTSTTAAVTP